MSLETLRAIHLLGAVLWPLAAALGLLRARRLHRRRARMRMYLLMALGLVVGANSLVMALADVHPHGTAHPVAVAVLGVFGAVLLYLVASYGNELVEEEGVLRALSGGRLGEASGADQPAKPLTRRELDVLLLVCRGVASQELASQLGISYHTVITHVHHLLQKVGVSSRVDLVAWAIRVGLYDPFTGTVSDRVVARMLDLPRPTSEPDANR